MAKLRYRISKWEQATKCKSNLSDKYRIHVSDVMYVPDISGLLIQVEHESAGVVFAALMNPSGERVDSDARTKPLTTQFVLQELAVFGFLIDYTPENKLPENQKAYLQELLQLFMDRIRILYVSDVDQNGNIQRKPILTAYSSAILPYWSLANYSCSTKEFNDACGSGYAIRLNTNEFDWSWLTYSANIKDLLDNK